MNLNRKGILSLENDNVAQPTVTADEIELGNAQARTYLLEAAAQDDQILEAQGLTDTLGAVIENVEKRDDSVPIGQAEAAAVAVTLEHIFTRLGVAPNVRVSNESLNEPVGGQRKTAIEKLKRIHRKAVEKLELAIEAFGADFGQSAHSLRGVEAVMRLDAGSLKSAGASTPKKISGAWLGYFYGITETVTGSEMGHAINQTTQKILQSQAYRSIEEFAQIVKNISMREAESVRTSNFENRIIDIMSELGPLVDKLSEQIRSSGSGHSVNALTKEEAADYSAKAQRSLADLKSCSRTIVEMVNDLEKIESRLQKSVVKKTTGRWVGAILGIIGAGVGFIPGILLGWLYDTVVYHKNLGTKENNYRKMRDSLRAGSRAIAEFEQLLADVAHAMVAYPQRSGG